MITTCHINRRWSGAFENGQLLFKMPRRHRKLFYLAVDIVRGFRRLVEARLRAMFMLMSVVHKKAQRLKEAIARKHAGSIATIFWARDLCRKSVGWVKTYPPIMVEVPELEPVYSPETETQLSIIQDIRADIDRTSQIIDFALAYSERNVNHV